MPFAVTATVAFVLALVPVGQVRWGMLLAAAVLNFLTFGTALLLSSERFPPWLDVVPPIAYVAAVAALRDALGGSGSGYEGLFVLPLLWVSLYGTSRQVRTVWVATAIAMFAPLVIAGGSRYPVGGWRIAVLWFTMGTVIGTAVHRLVERTRQLARTDDVTGLLNRTGVMIELHREQARYRRDNARLSIALLAFDNFNEVVDQRGHDFADRSLARWASQWKSGMRITDAIGRISDNEFLMILPACYPEHAAWVVDRIVRKPVDEMTCSAGILSWNGRDEPAQMLATARDLLSRRAPDIDSAIMLAVDDAEEAAPAPSSGSFN